MLREIESRRSIRRYKDQPVADADILRLLESARLAPSGHNTQPWNFIIVRSKETQAQLSQANHGQEWMLSAPVFLVCVADIQRRIRIRGTREVHLDENSPDQALKQIIRDSSIAITHILLQAEHMGLGACWAGWFAQRDVRTILHIPDDKYVCGIICVGYPDEAPEPRPRLPLEDIVRYEVWE